MISTLGKALVLIALFFAAFGAVQGFIGGKNRTLGAWKAARIATYLSGSSIILANFLMVYALIIHDFSVAYVAEVGSRNTPLYYTIISLWSSLNGSILFWGGILGVYSIALAWRYHHRYREYMPYTLGVLLSVSVFFYLLIASISNPFEAVFPVPADGPGPNPLLQNHWLMAYHPPTLYLGYVGMSVPFAMASAGLLAGRIDAGWVRPMRKWFLIPWISLTVGIIMGSWWSYEVLGWGGYWAWDPVENASFMPWLTGTAFLHSAMVLERKGQLKTWTLLLANASFILTLLGTFMTRSGVFNSVHSFTQSDIGIVFLLFIAIVFVFSVLLVATRDHVLYAEGSLYDHQTHPISREFTILVQNLLFSAFTFVVLLGVLYPLIAEAFLDTKVSVGEPFFNRFSLPIGLAIVFLMGVGPKLPWGRWSAEQALLRLVPSFVSAILVGGLSYAFLGYSSKGSLYAIFAFSLCAFAFVANLEEFITPVRQRIKSRQESLLTSMNAVFRRGRRRFGGHIAHLGVIAAVVSIAASSAYKIEKDVILRPGESVQLGVWNATFESVREVQEEHRRSEVALFAVTRGEGTPQTLEPRLNYYERMPEPIGTPKVITTLVGDFYLSLLQIDPNGQQISVRAISSPMMVWLWISAAIIALGTLLALWPNPTKAST